MDLLLDFQGSKRQIVVPTCDVVCEAVTKELRRWKEDSVVKISNDCSSSSEPARVFILQRWSSKWNMFVDVQNLDEIVDRDRITVIPRPVGSPVCGIFTIIHFLHNIIFILLP